jgi:hypothetical protein
MHAKWQLPNTHVFVYRSSAQAKICEMSHNVNWILLSLTFANWKSFYVLILALLLYSFANFHISRSRCKCLFKRAFLLIMSDKLKKNSHNKVSVLRSAVFGVCFVEIDTTRAVRAVLESLMEIHEWLLE